MIAFEVYLNGKKLCTAGCKEFGDVCAHVIWRRGPHVKLVTAFEHEFELAELAVGGTNVRYKSKKAPHLKPGFSYSEGLEWVKRKVKVGDEFSIRIIETRSIDKPRERIPGHPQDESLRANKRFVRQIAKYYGWKVVFQRRARRSVSNLPNRSAARAAEKQSKMEETSYFKIGVGMED